MKKNKKPQNYMQFLEEAAGVNIFNNLDSYSNPAKDIITWRGKKRKLLDTTIKSKDLDALVTDIVGKKGTKKVDSQFAEDFDFRNDGLDDLLEDDYGQGYDNLEEGWEYDGLEDIAESGDDEVNDPLTGLEEEGNEDEDGLYDLIEDADPDEDDEDDYDDDTLEESAFLDEDGEDLDIDFEELSESAIDDDDDDDDEDTTPEVVEESDDSPLSMLEADTDEVSAVSALIQEIESLEDEGEYAISYDEYNDGIQEETDIVSAEEILQLRESKSSKFVKGKEKPEVDDSSDDDEDEDEDEDDSEDDDFDEDEYEDD